VRTKFKQAKALERKGQWRLACEIYEDILENVDPFDAHSHLGLARLQARRATTDSDARASFERGTQRCPTSVHLLQAWAVYEDTLGNIPKARELFERALVLDAYNPYVCHAYGLLEKKQQQRPTQTQQHRKSPQELWERALQKSSTAALVCSLGELFIEQKEYSKARELYNEHLPYMQLPKDRMEVYLALAWLEERYMYNAVEAQQLLQRALEEQPTSSLIHVALARLETREQQQKTIKRRTDNSNKNNRKYKRPIPLYLRKKMRNVLLFEGWPMPVVKWNSSNKNSDNHSTNTRNITTTEICCQ